MPCYLQIMHDLIHVKESDTEELQRYSVSVFDCEVVDKQKISVKLHCLPCQVCRDSGHRTCHLVSSSSSFD